MRRAVGIGRASVRSWNGEGIGSVFVGTAAPGTVTQQRRHQASTGGEPIRSRAQFALLTRAWATERPLSSCVDHDHDSQLQVRACQRAARGGEVGRRHATDPTTRNLAKETSGKRANPASEASQATTPTKREITTRKNDADTRRAVACKETTAREGWVCAQRKAGIGWAISYLEPEPLVCPCEGLLFEVDVGV